MKKIEPWKKWSFIGALIVIATLVNGAYDRLFRKDVPSNARRAMGGPPQKTPEELAAERARFLARYMNDRPSRAANLATVGVVAVNESGRLHHSLAAVLAERVKKQGATALPSLFTPEFVADGLFTQAFDGSPQPLTTLELREVLDALLLARQQVEYATNTALENVITASMRVEVAALSVVHRGESQSWTFSATGAGFNPALARQAAEERFIKQLSAATNIVIPPAR